MIKLRRLAPGDRVALVAPASSFAAEEVGGGVAELQRLGLEAVYDDSLFARDRFVAGSALIITCRNDTSSYPSVPFDIRWSIIGP